MEPDIKKAKANPNSEDQATESLCRKRDWKDLVLT